jgi:ammonia channel protein AmtB
MQTVLAQTAFFKEQVGVPIYLSDVFFLICTAALIVAVVGVGLIDSGASRLKNVADTWIQKIVGSLIAAGTFLVIGFAIWMWQYYEMSGISGPLGAAIGDWWIAGEHMTGLAQTFDPAATGEFNLEVDVFQVFVCFFATFMAFAAALLHGAGLERLKAVPYFVMCAVAGGIVIPVILYLTWGSASPLTNEGLHDYVGLFGLYIFVGVWALILAWRLGPRIGAFTPDSRTSGPKPSNLGMVGAGVVIIAAAVPFIALGCGFIIPDVGYLGISMTTSGFGRAAINVIAGLAGGALGGAILAYRTRNLNWALLGPLTGYIAGTAMFDITKPWIMLLLAIPAPFISLATYNLLRRLRIDEAKVVPLALGPGIYAALLPGIVHWGTKTGGFIGVTEGEFAFQHAEITLWWQLIGLGVTIAIAAVSGLLVIVGLEKTVGIRVTEADELAGLDHAYWDAAPIGDLDDLPVGDPEPLDPRREPALGSA